MPRPTHDRVRLPSSQHDYEHFDFDEKVDDILKTDMSGNSHVKHEDKDGNTYLFTRNETKEVLKNIVDEIITEENMDMYKITNEKITRFVENTNQEIINKFNDIYNKKIDSLVEVLYQKIMTSEIEKEVERRLEVKLEKMREVLKTK